MLNNNNDKFEDFDEPARMAKTSSKSNPDSNRQRQNPNALTMSPDNDDDELDDDDVDYGDEDDGEDDKNYSPPKFAERPKNSKFDMGTQYETPSDEWMSPRDYWETQISDIHFMPKKKPKNPPLNVEIYTQTDGPLENAEGEKFVKKTLGRTVRKSEQPKTTKDFATNKEPENQQKSLEKEEPIDTVPVSKPEGAAESLERQDERSLEKETEKNKVQPKPPASSNGETFMQNGRSTKDDGEYYDDDFKKPEDQNDKELESMSENLPKNRGQTPPPKNPNNAGKATERLKRIASAHRKAMQIQNANNDVIDPIEAEYFNEEAKSSKPPKVKKNIRRRSQGKSKAPEMNTVNATAMQQPQQQQNREEKNSKFKNSEKTKRAKTKENKLNNRKLQQQPQRSPQREVHKRHNSLPPLSNLSSKSSTSVSSRSSWQLYPFDQPKPKFTINNRPPWGIWTSKADYFIHPNYYL